MIVFSPMTIPHFAHEFSLGLVVLYLEQSSNMFQ